MIIIQKHLEVWQYCNYVSAVDNNNTIVNFAENDLTDSFNFKVKMTGQTEIMEQKMLK